MDERIRETLFRVGREHGTPAYVYLIDEIRDRFDALRDAFEGRFDVSYAVKANPNAGILTRIRDKVRTLDVSSISEAERAVRLGYRPAALTFSGPAKRPFELARAVELGIGEIVCEGEWEIGELDRLAAEAGRRVSIFPRINPSRTPRKFGVNMAGRPSQFGMDEEHVDAVLERRDTWRHLDVRGLHIYSGTNSLSEDAIAENFEIFIELFERFAGTHDLRPEKLIFGSGFGIPYVEGEEALDLSRLASLVNPQIDSLKEKDRFRATSCVLEMGRWLVGPCGYLMTSVINEKHSRGTDIRLCDAGFNNHLAACGMMGSVIRRNWHFTKLNKKSDDPVRPYLLVGPLCTTIDQLAANIELPELSRGDLLAVDSSGAYGLTASPTRFISHPDPRELVVSGVGEDVEVVDVTEWTDNTPAGNVHLPAGSR